MTTAIQVLEIMGCIVLGSLLTLYLTNFAMMACGTTCCFPASYCFPDSSHPFYQESGGRREAERVTVSANSGAVDLELGNVPPRTGAAGLR
jgi:hypothetical protein